MSHILEGEFADGWRIVLACFLASAVVFGTTYSFGVFFDRFVADFAADHARLSLVFGVQTVVMYVGAVGIGGLVDRIGEQRAVAIGATLLLGGLLITSRSHTLLTLVFGYGIVTALGMSVLYIVAYATVPKWFVRRRGFANGLATAGLGVGIMVVAPFAGRLLDRLDWRTAYLVLAGVFFVVLLAVYLLIEDVPEGRADATAGPADAERDDAGPEDWRAIAATVGAVGRSSRFLAVFAGWVLVYATLYVVLTYLPTYTASVGLGSSVGVAAIGVLGGVTAVARVIVGFVSDSLGRLRIFVANAAVMGLSVVALAAADSRLAVVATVVVFGIAYGGNGALLSPLIADLFGHERLGTVFGMISVAFAVAGLLAPVLAGVGFDALGRFGPVLLATGAAGVLGAGAIAVGGLFLGPRPDVG